MILESSSCKLPLMTTTTPSYEKATIKKLDRSRVEITGSIVPTVWEKYRKEALKNINNAVTIDGFRNGMVPENILIGKVGEMSILEEMAELTLSKVYIDILINEKIDAIGKPEIRVTKLAAGNPLEFVAVTSVVPTVTLPDYKKLAAEVIKKADPKDLKVEEKDIEEAILKIRKRHANEHLHSEENKDEHDHLPAQAGEKMTPEEHDKAIEKAMPEVTDDFVKTIGDFKDIPDFKNKLSDMISEQKRDSAREKLRLHIADALAEAAVVELPDVMIESELERTQAQFSADIERMGVKLDDYMKHAKKTIEELRAEWKPHAEKKAKLQLILNEISVKEKIAPDKKEIEEEVNHIVEHYKDADRERATTYAETVLTNEKVFQFLEKAE